MIDQRFLILRTLSQQQLDQKTTLRLLETEDTASPTHDRVMVREFPSVVALQKELKRLTVMACDAVVSVVGSGVDKVTSVPYMALEGWSSTLREAIPKYLSQPGYEMRRCIVLAGVLSDLAALHMKGVVHLDLKPDTVGLFCVGEPRLLDMSLAQPFDELHAGDIPSPAFAAPEVCLL